MKEAVVLIIDANETMATKVAVPGDKSNCVESDERKIPTRFDCAKEAAIAILCDLMIRSKTNEATVVLLHTETTNNYFYEQHDDDDKSSNESENSETERHCPFPAIMELSGNGRVMGIRQPLPDLLRTIQQLKPTSLTAAAAAASRGKRNRGPSSTGGDFESGLVYAADALHRRTAGKKFDRRIVLLTDAEHRVGNTYDSQQRLLVALDSLRAMECRIEVVGMDFERAADFDAPASGPSEMKNEDSDASTGSEIDDDSDSEEESEEESDENDKNVDILDIKRENEEYLIRLANTTGGFVYASKELQDILQKVLGSRVVENPSKRKLIVEIAPGLVLEDARFYKLISKTASMPLKKKLVMVDPDSSHGKTSSIEPRKNALGEEMLQDYETVNTRWNAEDENEELLEDRITHAYRFGSDLLPFSYLDEAGLKQRSPVKLTVLGYVPESSVPHYLRIDSPYVLTGNDSRRCCAAISALATALYRQKKVAIATFVKGNDKDPILCGLFPLLPNENETRERINGVPVLQQSISNPRPLRLIIMQLPFSGDVRYPHLDYPDSSEDDLTNTPSARCCDDLIDNLMLRQQTLDYKHTPNHKVRSFYKTVVKRVLDKTCDVVSTRIDTATGTDSMDTPLEIKKRAQHAVTTFYDTFRLMERNRGDGI